MTKRFDPVTPVHKIVRHFMFEVTTQVGALDVTDIIAIAHCSERVKRLFNLLNFDDAEVKPLLNALLETDETLRRDAAADLYRVLNRVVSNQLVAQQREISLTSVLWSQHTDSELRALRYHQLAVMSDGVLADTMRGMEVALNPQEITAVLTDVQAFVSPEYFAFFSVRSAGSQSRPACNGLPVDLELPREALRRWSSARQTSRVRFPHNAIERLGEYIVPRAVGHAAGNGNLALRWPTARKVTRCRFRLHAAQCVFCHVEATGCFAEPAHLPG